MCKLLCIGLSVLVTMSFAADLPAKKYRNLAAIKTMVAGAEAEARKRNVEVTICIVDESWQPALSAESRCCVAEHHHMGAEKGAACSLLQSSLERRR